MNGDKFGRGIQRSQTVPDRVLPFPTASSKPEWLLITQPLPQLLELLQPIRANDQDDLIDEWRRVVNPPGVGHHRSADHRQKQLVHPRPHPRSLAGRHNDRPCHGRILSAQHDQDQIQHHSAGRQSSTLS
jgi:hypothetical protein